MNANAKKFADQAVEATQKVQQILNDPNKIDNLAARIIVYLLLLVVLYFFWKNSDPYASAIRGVTGASEGWLVSALGLIAVAAVQYGEIQPFLASPEASNEERKHRNRIALICYGLDVAVCYHRWPLFKDAFMGIPLLSNVDWANIWSIIVIVFGLSGWFLIRKSFMRKF